MASGVKISDDVKDLIAKMKVVKNKDNAKKRVKLAIFDIINNETIDVIKQYTQEDLGDTPVFSIVCKEMDERKCFYALYDCNFQTKDNVDKDELVFLTWTSDAECIKNKMIYASSKNSLKGCMRGVKHDLHVNDRSDFTRQDLAEKIQDGSSSTVAKIENVDI